MDAMKRWLAVIEDGTVECLGVALLHPEVAFVEAVVDAAEEGALCGDAGVEVGFAFEGVLSAEHEVHEHGDQCP